MLFQITGFSRSAQLGVWGSPGTRTPHPVMEMDVNEQRLLWSILAGANESQVWIRANRVAVGDYSYKLRILVAHKKDGSKDIPTPSSQNAP